MESVASSSRRSGLLSPDISIELHHAPEPSAFASAAPRSAPPDMQHFPSPMRHHRRTPSAQREVIETLNARSEYANDDMDGRLHHRINQYIIKEEIGRGSFGAVHLATDQFGHEFAVKEFSKARLRKRVQSSLLRHGPKHAGYPPGRAVFGAPDAPIARLANHKVDEAKDALFLIREEIAIMKKLNHENLVQLIEVLDDPDDDSLYMVLEMCKKGVVMKVGVHQTAEPYDEEKCRHYFRDLILGIEYLHSQGVVHRDIKPDNLLITSGDVLKVVDFGVSEMFAKSSEMKTAKSAGSPAFLPPELCIARHGDVSGKAADIWSMGVTLYCLRYGRIPFERDSVLDMYGAIKTETPKYPPYENERFLDLMSRLMEKDPEKRITMDQLREHPWVTRGGEDPLLSHDENCTDPLDLPNDLEVNHAFTRRMSHLLCVMRAINKFKSLLKPKDTAVPSQEAQTGQEQGEGVVPQLLDGTVEHTQKNKKVEESTEDHIAKILKEREQFLKSTRGGKLKLGMAFKTNTAAVPEERSDTLLLGIGTGGLDSFSATDPVPLGVVSDSPTAAEFNIYDRAFTEEVDRIKRSTSRKGSRGTGRVYPTKFNERNYHGSGSSTASAATIVNSNEGTSESDNTTARSSLTDLTSQARGPRLADLVAQAMTDSKGKTQ
ncbi:kinase-like domain-containing protein [Cercophora newfieldiana]|uniref:Kinase-like domain-containing protein n=1 Tax=Cercophora newfieldiana TaxID=92897 RepID=A0AA39Y4L5_9PEZI|nr:kinase-like domain-containing protein [Cercophora newfieldiana]